MSTGGEQDLQSAKRQKAIGAAQQKAGPPVTTPYAVKEAVADSGPAAAVAEVKDSVVVQLGLYQHGCALSHGREYGADDIAAIVGPLGPLFTHSTTSAHTTELQRALLLAAGDPSYERYDEAVFVVAAWQGVTITDAVADILVLGHYTYRIRGGAWRDDPTYQFQIVMRHEDGWRIEQLDAVPAFDGNPAASSGTATAADQTTPAVPPASANSFDRQKTATAAVHYGACTTFGCYWFFGNNGSDPNSDYSDFANLPGGDDCTNFVSEMLAIGGLAQSSSDLAVEDPAAWYSKLTTMLPPGLPESVIFRAHNWTAVTLFWEYMSGQHNPHGRNLAYFTRNDPSSNINDADLADVIVYDWGTTTQPNYSHVSLETGFGAPSNYGYTNSGGSADPGFYGDLISQHSPGRSNHPWNWGYISQHNALYRMRMRDRGWYVMHWGEHGTNGYAFLTS